MQAVILAGGLATRLGDLTRETAKSMISVAGKPFLEHQLGLLRRRDFCDVVLCIGHLGGQIRDYFGSGAPFGVRIEYSDEGGRLLGTGGALKGAEGLLEDVFMLMWGDSYLIHDYADVWASLRDPELEGTMMVYRNDNEGDKSNVAVRAGKVAVYDKWSEDAGLVYIDNGLSILRRGVLSRIPAGEVFAIETVFRDLAAEGRLGAYVTEQKFFEVGSEKGIEALERHLRGEGMEERVS